MIREICREDIEPCIRIYLNALPNDFLPSLGFKFLQNTFFEHFLIDKKDVVKVFEKNGCVVGFVALSKLPHRTTKKISNHLLSLFLTFARAFLRNPKRFIDIIGIFFSRTILTSPISFDIKTTPEIYCIAVKNEYQSQGIGALLLNEIKDELRSQKLSHLIVKTSSKEALRFYIKNGFQEIGYEQRATRKFLILKVDLLD